MTRYLLDLNTLLALLDPRHVFHDAAHTWLGELEDFRLLTTPIVQNGVLRVASQSAYPNTLGTTSEVWSVLKSFCADPRHEFCPDDLSLLDAARILRPEQLTPSRVTDLYLLALAVEHFAQLTTFDRRIPAEAIAGGPQHLTLLSS